MRDEIVEQGVVTKVTGDTIEVKVLRPGACLHCVAKNACETFGSKKDHIARARNMCDAKTGDAVRIRVPATGLLLSAFIIYFVPAAAMFGGAILGRYLLAMESLSRDVASILGGLSLFALSIAFVFIYSWRRRDTILPEAFEILPEGEGGSPLSCEAR